ncbi:hypothetical protein PR048_017320 [Dryococelus australis]|uniref:Integrase catalytic domain-containing protein n=1 Tax=Dryococelus australis TaxID=614101 RepID=A0ABQ9H970_9NEOP|nr:hypothetical protein PR048_017320 [Dryococelus australis]
MLASSYVWWKGMDENICRTNERCPACQQTQNTRKKGFQLNWLAPQDPWERIHLNLFHFNSVAYLILCDAYSKWVECFVLPIDTSFQSVFKCLLEVFNSFAFPRTAVCDNGPPFRAQELAQFCRLLFFPHTTPFQMDGLSDQYRHSRSC